MSASGIAKSRMERILRLHEQVDEIKRDIRDIYAEEKSDGGDKTAMGNAISIIRKRAKDKGAFDEREALTDVYLNAYQSPSHTHAPARARENIEEFPVDRGAEVGVDTPHDPETGEILESVQSHEALGPSAPAESASGEISATNQPETAKDSPHHLVPTRGDDAAMASSQQEGATGRQPVDTLRAGRTGSVTVTAGEAATNPNPQPVVSDQYAEANTAIGLAGPACAHDDAAANTKPAQISSTFTNPKCLKPKTCPNAHSKTACFDCVMEYANRPKEEQVRLWQEAIGALAA